MSSQMPELRADVSPAAKPFPRLAISDLLVLTLMVSFGLGWMESLGSGDPPAESLWRTVVLSVLEATLLGGLFFGFAVLAREFVRGRPLRSLSPAHWWFVVAAPQLLFGLAHYVIAIWSPTWFAGNQGQWRIFESS